MKRISIFVLFLGFSLTANASDSLPFETLKSLAITRAQSRWGEVAMGPVMPCYDLNNNISTFIFTFKINSNVFPQENEIDVMIEEGNKLEAKSNGNIDLYIQALSKQFGTNTFGKVVVGARYDRNPIYVIGNGLPPHYYNRSKAEKNARAYLKSSFVKFVRIYYLTPLNEFFEYSDGQKSVLINCYSLQLVNCEDLKDIGNSKISLRSKWGTILANSAYREKFDGYVPNVPTIPLWSYGCGPTAAAQMFWFWDWFINPNGYGRFVNHFFDRWDSIVGAWRYNLPNIQRELVIAADIDTFVGGMSPDTVPGTFKTVFMNHGYTCSSSCYFCDSAATVMRFLKPEIDAGRPVLWGVYNYGPNAYNHWLCAVGYKFIPGETLLTVHTTWNLAEEDWTIWTPNCLKWVGTLIPMSGQSNNNIKVMSPNGEFMFPQLKYRMRWTTNGTGIDHCKIWWAPNRWWGYDSLNWTVITTNSPNSGSYVFTTPNLDTVIRLNISGLDAANRQLAAHGSYFGNQVVSPISSSNLKLIGHCQTEGSAYDVWSDSCYAYVADGLNGVLAVNVSDTSLPEIVGRSTVRCDARRVFLVGPRLYVCDALCTLRIFDVTNPTNINQIGKWGTTSELTGLFIRDTLAFVTTKTNGLHVVCVSNPGNLYTIGAGLNPNQIYNDITVLGNFAYIAADQWGLRIINIRRPRYINEVGFYDSPGRAKGVAINGNWVYLADGSIGGLRIVDVTDSGNPQLRGVYDSPGEALKCKVISNTVYLADGEDGLRILDVTNPDDPKVIGNIDVRSPVNDVAVPRLTRICLAASDNGMPIATFTNSIEEAPGAFNHLAYRLYPASPNPFSDRTLIVFQIPSTNKVSLKLYDVQGRVAETLVEKLLIPGVYRYSLTNQRLSSGIYFLIFKAGNYQQKEKVLLIK